jgi:hypothetical protein
MVCFRRAIDDCSFLSRKIKDEKDEGRMII